MKRNLTAAGLGLAAIVALSGCSSMGSHDNDLPGAAATVSPSPSVSGSQIPNNAGGTANNGANNGGSGITGNSGTTGNGGTAGTNGAAGSGGTARSRSTDGNYYAGGDGDVSAHGGDTGHGLLGDAEDALRDAARGVGRVADDLL